MPQLTRHLWGCPSGPWNVLYARGQGAINRTPGLASS